jgi:hypothetical protein
VENAFGMKIGKNGAVKKHLIPSEARDLPYEL